ncbi:LysR family transcriptional regulator [Pararhodobacter zhoushanensis]|uniref:LysR family transcriptional regulator n=1 Tax=Pararhodobacter zhoushanensis TaxID=2479545 RepID=UPI000F8C71FC|nr:LysR family transcriptional regulator [Pararhodobacter zhoushanensis]
MKSDTPVRVPLRSLRYLEPSVRLGSIDLAAQELNVTPSAVSQQIKRIEDSLSNALSETFALVEAGVRQAMTDGGAQSVKIRLYQTWPNRCLVPRLESFTRTHPMSRSRLRPASRPWISAAQTRIWLCPCRRRQRES